MVSHATNKNKTPAQQTVIGDHSGWVRWHRSYVNCEALGNGNNWAMVGAWAAIIAAASHKDKPANKEPLHGYAWARGEFGFTYRKLSGQWEKSLACLISIFKHFAAAGMLEIRVVGRISICRVLNYDKYQSTVTKNETDAESTVTKNETVTPSTVTKNETVTVTKNETEGRFLYIDKKNVFKKKSKKKENAAKPLAPADLLAFLEFWNPLAKEVRIPASQVPPTSDLISAWKRAVKIPEIMEALQDRERLRQSILDGGRTHGKRWACLELMLKPRTKGAKIVWLVEGNYRDNQPRRAAGTGTNDAQSRVNDAFKKLEQEMERNAAS